MGVGTPLDILEAVKSGIDLFDCVIPTRNARNGFLYTSKGIVKIRNSKYSLDISPVDESCNVTLVVTLQIIFTLFTKKEKKCWVLNSIRYIIYFFI